RETPNQLLGTFGLFVGGLPTLLDTSPEDTLAGAPPAPPPGSTQVAVGTSSPDAGRLALVGVERAHAQTGIPAGSSQTTAPLPPRPPAWPRPTGGNRPARPTRPAPRPPTAYGPNPTT